MRRRPAALDRLATRFECGSDWSAMAEDGCGRHCAACDRHVLDFERLTAGEARRHLAASRGTLCARVVRRDGRVVTASLPEWASSAGLAAPGPGSAVVAGLVAAWLAAAPPPAAGLGESPAAVAPPEPGPRPVPHEATPAAAGASVAGRLVDGDGHALPGAVVAVRDRAGVSEATALTDSTGAFAIAGLPEGIYDVAVALEGFLVAPAVVRVVAGRPAQVELEATTAALETVTVGGVGLGPAPLHEALHESRLAMTAVVGRSRVVGRDGSLVHVVTRLRPAEVFHGRPPGGDVRWFHSEYDAGRPEGPRWRAEVAPGTRVLAFLKPSEDPDAPAGHWEATDFGYGIRRLDDATLAATVERLEALLAIEREHARLGTGNPAAFTDWLVAMAEDPLTRQEAIGELRTALWDLDALAEEAGVATELVAADLRALVERATAEGVALPHDPEPVVVGALLDEARRERLLAALLATETLGEADRALFDVVWRQAPEPALGWLTGRLAATPVDPELPLVWWLADLAEELDDAAAGALAAVATERVEAISRLWSDEEPEASGQGFEEQVAEVERELRRALVTRWSGAVGEPEVGAPAGERP